jgi:hypothetical protein
LRNPIREALEVLLDDRDVERLDAEQFDFLKSLEKGPVCRKHGAWLGDLLFRGLLKPTSPYGWEFEITPKGTRRLEEPVLGIDIWRLEPFHRGRKVVVVDGEYACPAILRNWNEKFLFLQHWEAEGGGHCDPSKCRWFDEDRDQICDKPEELNA